MVKLDYTIRNKRKLGSKRKDKLEELLDRKDLELTHRAGGRFATINTGIKEQSFFGGVIAKWSKERMYGKDFFDNDWKIKIYNEDKLDVLKDVFRIMELEFPQLGVTFKLL